MNHEQTYIPTVQERLMAGHSISVKYLANGEQFFEKQIGVDQEGVISILVNGQIHKEYDFDMIDRAVEVFDSINVHYFTKSSKPQFVKSSLFKD